MLTVERSDEGVSAQCEKLADISDFTFAYDLIDGQNAVEQSRSFLPFTIESSKWHVIEEGLKCVQVHALPAACTIRTAKYPYMQLSGLEPCLLKPEVGFQWVGERCNLMGSAKFKKLVDPYRWNEAMKVCPHSARVGRHFRLHLRL